jgi:ribosome-binding factor A
MNHDPKNSKNIAISTTRRRFFTNIAPHENNQVNSDSQQTQWNQNHDKSKKALRNPALQSVIDEGLNILQSISSDIQAKTKRRLLLSDEDTGPSPDQLREAARIKHFTEDAIELYTSRKGNLFCVMKEPIVIVDVEITKDLRQARVFWSLPYGVLLMDGISAGMRMRSAERMQKVLDERGGVLQGLVHQKMRGYFRPPKIRFVMAEGEMLRRYLKELL